MDLRGILGITSKISRMTLGITKFELVLNKYGGLWKFGARRFSSGFTINSRDHAPLIGGFEPLKELND